MRDGFTVVDRSVKLQVARGLDRLDHCRMSGARAHNNALDSLWQLLHYSSMTFRQRNSIVYFTLTQWDTVEKKIFAPLSAPFLLYKMFVSWLYSPAEAAPHIGILCVCVAYYSKRVFTRDYREEIKKKREMSLSVSKFNLERRRISESQELKLLRVWSVFSPLFFFMSFSFSSLLVCNNSLCKYAYIHNKCPRAAQSAPKQHTLYILRAEQFISNDADIWV